MALQLNEQAYREFSRDTPGKYASNISQMPALKAEGLVPMSVNGLMKRRLEVQDKAKFSEAVRSDWMDNYFDTGDGIAYHPDGKVKIVLDSNDLRELNPKSKLTSSGALILPEGTYDKLEGPQFTREQLGKYVGNWLSSDEAKSNPLWQALARDPKLLNEYVDSIFAQASQRFKYDKNMGLYVSDAPKQEEMRLWTVRRLLNGRSYAGGRLRLGADDGRLVGVEPEARVAPNVSAQTLEQRV